jgi:hypothetical protein
LLITKVFSNVSETFLQKLHDIGDTFEPSNGWSVAHRASFYLVSYWRARLCAVGTWSKNIAARVNRLFSINTANMQLGIIIAHVCNVREVLHFRSWIRTNLITKQSAQLKAEKTN